MRLARPLENLIDQLVKLPGIGPKTAQRLALYILKLPVGEAKALAAAILEAREKVHPCRICGNLTDEDCCSICSDQNRDDSLLCIVEEAGDIVAIDRSGYNGRYYVLNRDINLLDRNDLQETDLEPLIKLLSSGKAREVILALNPDMDGEVMSRYLASVIGHIGVKVTRLAHGLPVGGDIEFSDEITLRKALEGRKEF